MPDIAVRRLLYSPQFWYQEGRAIFRDTIDQPWFEDTNTITGPWIDSDSAIVIADAMGGKDFRSQHLLKH